MSARKIALGMLWDVRQRNYETVPRTFPYDEHLFVEYQVWRRVGRKPSYGIFRIRDEKVWLIWSSYPELKHLEVIV